MTGIKWVANGLGGLDDFAAVPCEPADPGPGELTVRITAAGVNPADLKHVARITDPSGFPAPIGYELAGVVTAVGPDTRAASGRVSIGDRIAAFRVHGAYATAMTIPAEKALVLSPDAPDDQAAGLLLAGCTAAEMLTRSGARAGDTVLLHGASGAVGAVFLQLAALSDVAVVGTAGPDRLGAVEQFGGIPVVYGPGLTERIREAAPAPVVAALDAAGTSEATQTSLTLVDDRSRIVTVVDRQAAAEHGFIALSGAAPASAAYRDGVRGELLKLLGAGELVVPIAQRFPLADAVDALRLVSSGRAHGKVVLIP
ncbi:quinone oxidoreductase family protein [Gordonia hydrophobica]|uniref:Zinc-binding dehydrogenase n=1 Tax=Gordonia hydrophobica TaxID=40516 RepID=A0ABZ2U5R8_9ACTN|nr:zinc-binding dehydrogenase [Gordonia hydrophobica]MBM7368776.1 NADPH:quinone reductase-like Zn-dependent oxidoreductase [Gordonia hydrophobica]